MKWWSSAVVVICFISASADAQSPWLVPLEERIAARTNEVLARERVRRATAAMENSFPRPPAPSARTVDDLSGDTNPELFLPHELFRTVISMAFLSPARTSQVFRESKAEHLKRLSFPPDFWDRLRSLSSAYIGDSARDEIAGRRMAGRRGDAVELASERAAIQHDLCRSLAAALQEARRVFGRERFDRFLYEAIAPHKHTAVTGTLPSAEQLLRLEQGCP